MIRSNSARYLKIASYLEVLPEPSNRITLSDKRDALDLPTPRINYDITHEYTLSALERLYKDYDQFKSVFSASEVLNDIHAWVPSSHIMGTTIMGDSPQDSVVNHECRTFDHANLFITSTSTHPSTTVVNPTLTGYALALRVADIINKEI